MSIEERLTALVLQEIAQAGGTPPKSLVPSMILAETGLDSLGFATIVVTMDKEFGLDPFGGTEDITYPETFRELLELYQLEQRRAEQA